MILMHVLVAASLDVAFHVSDARVTVALIDCRCDLFC
jgi:hypothetical protein